MAEDLIRLMIRKTDPAQSKTSKKVSALTIDDGPFLTKEGPVIDNSMSEPLITAVRNFIVSIEISNMDI